MSNDSIRSFNTNHEGAIVRCATGRIVFKHGRVSVAAPSNAFGGLIFQLSFFAPPNHSQLELSIDHKTLNLVARDHGRVVYTHVLGDISPDLSGGPEFKTWVLEANIELATHGPPE